MAAYRQPMTPREPSLSPREAAQQHARVVVEAAQFQAAQLLLLQQAQREALEGASAAAAASIQRQYRGVLGRRAFEDELERQLEAEELVLEDQARLVREAQESQRQHGHATALQSRWRGVRGRRAFEAELEAQLEAEEQALGQQLADAEAQRELVEAEAREEDLLRHQHQQQQQQQEECGQ